MTIAFIHPHKSFLPEIEAYTHFFSGYGIKTMVVHPNEINKINADVEWHFMGTDNTRNKKGVIKIHEYTSASIQPLMYLKNFSKRLINTKPDYRLFLNDYVKDQFDFTDGVPSGLRDMGIADSFLYYENKIVHKEYDFIYAGSVNKEREIEKLLDCFTKESLKAYSLLILSRDYEFLLKKYNHNKNIHFIGPVAHDEVKNYILKSKFAINFMPDKEPFNQQTSTKFLEYAALKIPVITTDYKWIKDFQKEEGSSFFYLDNDLKNFTWENISSFNYSFPDLKKWSWKNQIRKSGVLNFLNIG
jgi:glycosyltransferase involved in cell wall biosynthesis